MGNTFGGGQKSPDSPTRVRAEEGKVFH